MAATSSGDNRSSGPVLRSLSRYRDFNSPPLATSNMDSAFAFSTSFYSSSSTFFNRRSASPPRVSSTPSLRFSINDRPVSPKRSIAVSPRRPVIQSRGGSVKRTCMCSPTSHPGSFRCSLHKNSGNNNHSSGSYVPNRLNLMRSAMKNSIVRIGGVEGDLVRRALTALIRPSSHQQRRRAAFEPRPSRLSRMSKADDLW